MAQTTFLARAALVLAVLGLLVGTHHSAAQAAPPDRVPGRLLVRFRSDVAEERANALVAAAGARKVGELDQIGVHVLQLPPGASEEATVRAFGQQAEVEFAEPDAIVQAQDVIPNDPWYANWEGYLRRISCPTAWMTTTGSSDVIIAVIDTGIDGTHPDLAPKLVPGWNFYDNNANTSDVTGHGTMVAGTAAACSNNGTGVASVAWGCRIMPVRVSDTGGNATYSAIASGITWAADHGARVANVSFLAAGSSAISSAAKYFQQHGGVVTVSAGNYSQFSSAADDPYELLISAVDTSDLLETYSNTGNNIDLAAPGGSYTTVRGGGYSSAAGTSIAAPVVAGVAALVLSVNPSLTGDQVRDILRQSGDDLGTAGWDPKYGWGRINAAKAMALVSGSAPDTTPPTFLGTSPTAGSTVSGTVTVQASATDTGVVTSVSASVDGVNLGSSPGSACSFAWDTTTVTGGAHVITFTAIDQAGNTASTQVSVNVSNGPADTTPPTFVSVAPTGGASVSGTITVQASATDNVAVASISTSVDGVSLGSSSSANCAVLWDTSTCARGAHTLTFRAVDQAGNAATTQVTVTVDNGVDAAAPSVTITSPAAGASVSGMTRVGITAADNVGVKRVELYADGALVGAASSAPYSLTWDARKIARGPHVLQARAYDAAGNCGTSAAVNVYR